MRQPESKFFVHSQLNVLLDSSANNGKSVAPFYDDIIEAARILRERGAETPVAVLAGPAFAHVRIRCEQHGHPERPLALACGRLAGRPVALPTGATCKEEAFGVRVAAALGARILVLGREAQGLNPRLHPGDLMVFSDHINASGRNPLSSLDDPRLGLCFLDLSRPYDEALQTLAEDAAKSQGLTAYRGVYLDTPGGLSGTHDDLRAMRMLGADAVGTGGASEVIVGVQAGLKVLGLALVSEGSPSAGSVATRLSPLCDVVGRLIGALESCT